MAPIFGEPNYDFLDDNTKEISNAEDQNLTQMAFWYMIALVCMLLSWMLIFFCLRIIALRQKTRSPPQRRQFAGTRNRPSLSQNEPTIFVSPANYPPPPKYEVMDPPSYEEVVGIHYPHYPPSQFPITRPLAVALAQNATPPATNNVITNCNVPCPSTVDSLPNNVTQTSPNVATVANDRTSSVAVASS